MSIPLTPGMFPYGYTTPAIDPETAKYVHGMQGMYKDQIESLLPQVMQNLQESSQQPYATDSAGKIAEYNGAAVPAYHPDDSKLMSKVLDHARKEQEAKILQLKMDMAAQQAAANDRANAFTNQDAMWKAFQGGMLGAKGLQTPGLTRPDYAQGNLFPSEVAGNNADLTMATLIPSLAEKGATSQISTDTDRFNKQSALLNTLLSGAGNMAAAGIKGDASIQSANAKAAGQQNMFQMKQNAADQKLDVQRQIAYTNAAQKAFYEAFQRSAAPKKDSGLLDTNPKKTTYEIINDSAEPAEARQRFLDHAKEIYGDQLMTASGIIGPQARQDIIAVMDKPVPVQTIANGRVITSYLTPNQLAGKTVIPPNVFKAMSVKAGDENKAREAWKTDAIDALNNEPTMLDVARRYAISRLWTLDNFGVATNLGGK